MKTDYIHQVSCSLINTTKDETFFHENCHRLLLILLTKDGDTYPWQSFSWTTNTGSTRQDDFATFSEYLKKWSKYTIEDFRRLFRDDNVIIDLLDQVEQRPVGTNVPLINNETRPSDKEAGLRRLRSQKPELHQQVLGGELSVHAAMKIAGFRPKTIQISEKTKPEVIAEKIISEFGDEFAQQLKGYL